MRWHVEICARRDSRILGGTASQEARIAQGGRAGGHAGSGTHPTVLPPEPTWQSVPPMMSVRMRCRMASAARASAGT